MVTLLVQSHWPAGGGDLRLAPVRQGDLKYRPQRHLGAVWLGTVMTIIQPGHDATARYLKFCSLRLKVLGRAAKKTPSRTPTWLALSVVVPSRLWCSLAQD